VGRRIARFLQNHPLVGPERTFNLAEGGPEPGLTKYGHSADLRVLVCGGDGTVNWVLTTIDDLGLNPPPPVGIFPLGTGNDAARQFGWGYKASSLKSMGKKLKLVPTYPTVYSRVNRECFFGGCECQDINFSLPN
jgi:hypothetical protein